MKIAILGTRGIPASYSGFETAVEQLAEIDPTHLAFRPRGPYDRRQPDHALRVLSPRDGLHPRPRRLRHEERPSHVHAEYGVEHRWCLVLEEAVP